MGNGFGWDRVFMPLAMAALVFGCDSNTNTNVFPPGLEVLTPRVGVAAGTEAALLLRSSFPSRVSLVVDDVSLGTARSDDAVSALRFAVPEIGQREVRGATVVAISSSGGTESVEVELVGLGDVQGWVLGEGALEVVSLGSEAVVSYPSALNVLTAGTDVIRTVDIVGEVHAIAPDGHGGVIVAGESPSAEAVLLSAFDAERRELEALTELAPYEGSFLPVVKVNALHVDWPLVGAATADGMSLVDLESLEYCRKKSAETARLSPAIYDAEMRAVVVTQEPLERLVAVGAYLNVYEASEDGDLGGCDPVMPNWGTSVIANSFDGEEPWRSEVIALTESLLWINVAGFGILAVDRSFQRVEDIYFDREESTELELSSLPLSAVVDLAPSSGDRVWVAFGAEEGQGGVALMGLDGVELWIDERVLGGVPLKIDISPDSDVLWSLSSSEVGAVVVP